MIVDYINRYGDYQPYFANRNTNHLPMAQFAIHQLGGSMADLERFTVPYVEKRDFRRAAAARITITAENWKSYCGLRDHYRAFKVFFEAELDRLGTEGCMRLYFNQLMGGIAAEAFHCFIKMAYAVESNNKLEIANSLAYLSTTIFSVPERDYPVSEGLNCTDRIIEELENSEYYRSKRFYGGNIAQRIDNVFQDEAFFEYCTVPDFSNLDNLVYLRNTILKAHLIKWSFTSLHLVTGLHALSLLEDYAEDRTQLYAYFWVAALATLVTINQTKDTNGIHSLSYTTEPWPVIFEKAIDTLDDHVIKLVYSCYEEYKKTGNYLYHIVASKAPENRV